MIEGWMTRNELKFLKESAKKYDSIIEVGAWMGLSTTTLVRNCPGKVITIDHFRGSKETAHKGIKPWLLFADNMKELNLGIMKMDSNEAYKYLKPADMVFIDGAHDYKSVKEDIKNYLPLATKLICGHDYSDSWKGVKKAVNETFGEVGLVDSIWYYEI